MGAESCAGAQLLAVLLGSGGRGYSALDTANALLDRYGTLTGLMNRPLDEVAQVKGEMKSPLFSEHFNQDKWTLAYFDALRNAFTKAKGKTALEVLLVQKRRMASPEKGEEANGTQRLMEFAGAGAPTVSEGPVENAAVGEQSRK
jgi:DNA repair protein RadC